MAVETGDTIGGRPLDQGLVGDVPVPAPVEEPVAPAHTATLVGKSPARRMLGFVGQYAALVVLAAIVLIPILLTLIQALSPPAAYFREGMPLHPVSVDWADRSWWTGGAFSVIARTAVVAFGFVWVQMGAAGATFRAPRPLLEPRRALAVVAGTVAVAVMAGEVWSALVARAPTTLAWMTATVAVVAGTQLVGLVERERRLWAAALLAACTAIGVVAFAVVAFGATAWVQAWELGGLGRAMVNSFVMTVLIVACQLVTSVLAAYAFAFLHFPLKRTIFAVLMASLLLPIEVTLLANINLIRELGWIDTQQALVLPFAAWAFGIFLLRQGFLGIPGELHDATRLDGYGHLHFLWKFAVPLTRPVVASFTLISALYAWNQYLWPRSVLDSTAAQTLQIRLRGIATVEIMRANLGVAAALIAAIPILILLIMFQRQIIRGLTAGAVKG